MKLLKTILRVVLPLLIGGGIMWWMYRDMDWAEVQDGLANMNWWWMLASMPFCVLAQVLRAVRWRQMLAPLGEHPRLRTATISIYLSYASSLVIPRVGEVLRCGVLKRYDGTRFTTALGTVFTERIVDMLMMALIGIVVFTCQTDAFLRVAEETGAGIDPIVSKFSSMVWLIVVACAIVAVVFAVWRMRRMALSARMSGRFQNLKNGFMSVRRMPRKWLFVLYSLGIWLLYFLHFYIAMFAFDSTNGVGLGAAWVAFVIGTVAVLVPTPNGAGPWHFAVTTVLCIYGATTVNAATFCLITHTLQTLFTALLGVYGLLVMMGLKRHTPSTTN